MGGALYWFIPAGVDFTQGGALARPPAQSLIGTLDRLFYRPTRSAGAIYGKMRRSTWLGSGAAARPPFHNAVHSPLHNAIHNPFADPTPARCCWMPGWDLVGWLRALDRALAGLSVERETGERCAWLLLGGKRLVSPPAWHGHVVSNLGATLAERILRSRYTGKGRGRRRLSCRHSCLRSLTLADWAWPH